MGPHYDHKPSEKGLTSDQKLDLVIQILQGNPLDKDDRGLIGDFNVLKAKFYELKNWKDKTVAWAIGVAFGGGALITVLITLLINSLQKATK
jgi:hypothetical protein